MITSLFLPEEAGWYGANLVYVTREGEPLEADREGMEVTEVTLTSLESDAPSTTSTAKTKKKVKGKLPGIKTKSKTKP